MIYINRRHLVVLSRLKLSSWKAFNMSSQVSRQIKSWLVIASDCNWQMDGPQGTWNKDRISLMVSSALTEDSDVGAVLRESSQVHYFAIRILIQQFFLTLGITIKRRSKSLNPQRASQSESLSTKDRLISSTKYSPLILLPILLPRRSKF